MVDLKFSLKGTVRFLNRIKSAEKFSKGDGLNKMLDILAEKMLEFHVSRFKSEQTPDGGNWKQSRRAFAEKRATLQDTGRLLRSMVIFGVTANARQVGIPSSDSRNTRIGTIHNSVGDGKRKVIRRFIGFNNTELDKLNKLMADRLGKIF